MFTICRKLRLSLKRKEKKLRAQVSSSLSFSLCRIHKTHKSFRWSTTNTYSPSKGRQASEKWGRPTRSDRILGISRAGDQPWADGLQKSVWCGFPTLGCARISLLSFAARWKTVFERDGERRGSRRVKAEQPGGKAEKSEKGEIERREYEGKIIFSAGQ